MTDRSSSADPSHARGSLKEAIGKIIGNTDTIAEGAAEKQAADTTALIPSKQSPRPNEATRSDTEQS